MNDNALTDGDRKALAMILRLAAVSIEVRVYGSTPLDTAMEKMREAGQLSNPTLKRWAMEAAAWANGGYAVGCAGSPADVAFTMRVAADAVEESRWTPSKKEIRYERQRTPEPEARPGEDR